MSDQTRVTAAADLLNELTPETVGIYEAVTGEDGFPLRIVPVSAARACSVPDGIVGWRELVGRSTAKLSPPHPAALPDAGRAAVPPHEGIEPVLQHLCQPFL